MDFDWTHSFCLACDKQVQSAKDAYCSESCRLADFEKTSTPSSEASSPGMCHHSYPWSTKTTSTPTLLQSAYDFDLSKTSTSEQSTRVLTPSSSHSSLCSMQSTSTTGESAQLSAKTRQELRAYAVSFENVRMQRRRSY
ncbi:hypothetical protein BGZ63DRAFT_344695 [Mariannaea sp. PMI_226]|nr:hypothetical protein BGZ63DRAFT_344695 [Mariannaea sp. PMI_226]